MLERGRGRGHRPPGGTAQALGRGPRHVHNELAAARAHDDDLGFLESVISLAVDLTGRQVDAVPGTRVEFRSAARPAFDTDLPRDHVDHRLMRAVVTPAR